MTWKDKVEIQEVSRLPPPLSLDEGIYILEVVEEPERPVTTRFGLRLPYRVKVEGEEDVKTWWVAFREATTSDSLLGQLKVLSERAGGLKGWRLEVRVLGRGRNRRYALNLAEPRRPVEAEVGSQAALRFCPKCGNPTSASANYCQHCGFKLRGE